MWFATDNFSSSSKFSGCPHTNFYFSFSFCPSPYRVFRVVFDSPCIFVLALKPRNSQKQRPSPSCPTKAQSHRGTGPTSSCGAISEFSSVPWSHEKPYRYPPFRVVFDSPCSFVLALKPRNSQKQRPSPSCPRTHNLWRYILILGQALKPREII